MKRGFEQLVGWKQPGNDPRLQAVDGDEIDELVNFQLEQGRRDAR